MRSTKEGSWGDFIGEKRTQESGFTWRGRQTIDTNTPLSSVLKQIVWSISTGKIVGETEKERGNVSVFREADGKGRQQIQTLNYRRF